MCCIIETLVRRDWSGKWSEHGRRARVIYNLETLETSNGIRTNVLQQKLGLFSRTTNTMLGLMQYPQWLGSFSRNSQTCGSSATYRSTVPLFKSSNQMFYATQSILRPLSRTPSLGAVVSTRPNTSITKPNYDSNFYSSSRAKGKVTVNFKKISRQSLLHTITHRKILCFRSRL